MPMRTSLIFGQMPSLFLWVFLVGSGVVVATEDRMGDAVVTRQAVGSSLLRSFWFLWLLVPT